MKESDSRQKHGLILAGWLALVLVDIVIVLLKTPARTSFGQRLVVQSYDTAGLLVIGVVWTSIVSLLRRRARLRGARVYALLAILAAVLAYAPISEDVGAAVRQIPRAIPRPIAIGIVTTGASLAVPFAELLGRLLARRTALLACALGLGVAIHALLGLLYPQTYLGIHLLGTASCVVLVSAAMSATPLEPKLLTLGERTGRIVFFALGAASLGLWAHEPSGGTAALLAKMPTTVLAPYARRFWPERSFTRRVPDEQRAWFEERKDLPPIPAAPSMAPDRPIVILLGIDSMRAEILATEERRALLPALFRLREESIYFDAARSPGSSTAPSISTIFAGVYYSQLYWSPMREKDPIPYPWEDTTPRFPETLQAAGIHTVTFDAAGWLLNRYGIVRGFDEETTLKGRGNYASATAMESHVEERLQPDRVDGPTFLFVHFLDAHFPYQAGRAEPFDRYLDSLAFVDTEVAKLRAALEANGLWQRTILIVYADHGESFGEHDLKWHGASLYDELVRVPLLVRMPGRNGSVVHEPVSLVDLGPTILDLMGVPTPGHHMGESLVPLLRGESRALHRPLIAEARLKRSLVTTDGFKIVDDARNRAVEMFDLNADPRETTNLYDEDNPEAAARYDTLRTFFDVQTVKRPGYEVPYRKW